MISFALLLFWWMLSLTIKYTFICSGSVSFIPWLHLPPFLSFVNKLSCFVPLLLALLLFKAQWPLISNTTQDSDLDTQYQFPVTTQTQQAMVIISRCIFSVDIYPNSPDLSLISLLCCHCSKLNGPWYPISNATQDSNLDIQYQYQSRLSMMMMMMGCRTIRMYFFSVDIYLPLRKMIDDEQSILFWRYSGIALLPRSSDTTSTKWKILIRLPGIK